MGCYTCLSICKRAATA
ncbi:hypothetical protein [Pedobacter aquatilis]